MAKNGNMMVVNESEIEAALVFYGIKEAREKTVKLRDYAALVGEKRKWGNLTSSAWEREWPRAIVESITVASVFRFEAELQIADIGAGAGLLAFVLATISPQWKVTAIESAGRKATFMVEAAGKFGLLNLGVVNERAEKVAGRKQFSAVVSRAAGALKSMAPLAAPLLKREGMYVALKGSRAVEEIAEARGAFSKYGFGKVDGIKPPFPDWARERIVLVVARKM